MADKKEVKKEVKVSRNERVDYLLMKLCEGFIRLCESDSPQVKSALIREFREEWEKGV